MSKYTITPWRTPSDLLQVRSQLYPSSSSSSPTRDSRLTAVHRIMSWKLRGNLPHAIESAALLTDAILHHQSSSSASSFSIRAVYSAAFTRFVTGFCDIGRSRERMLEPSSMLEIAKKIGMPTEFVGLRHEATHEELPSLKRLVKATEEGLGWLWEVYWSRLKDEEVDVEMVDGVGSGEGLQRAREALKAFRSEKKLALKKKAKQTQAGEEEKTARECVRLAGSTVEGMESLVQVFVESKMLCPSKREIGNPLDGAYLIWDHLLKAISTQQPHFLVAFIKILQRAIGNLSTDDVEKEALCMWLVHTTSKKKSWTGSTTAELDALRTKMIMWCCTNPGYWSHFLGVHLIKAGGPDFADDWEDMLEASRLGDGYVGQVVAGHAETEEASSPDPEILEDAPHRPKRSKDVDVGGKSKGWRRAVAAPNLPIGVVR